MKPVIASILSDQYKIKTHTVWTPEIHEILLLLRLFPTKNIGRNLGTIISFNKAVDKLFVFREVS